MENACAQVGFRMTAAERRAAYVQILADLKAARELLSDRSRWMQRAMDDGHRFCMLGALRKVAGQSGRYPLACNTLAGLHLEAVPPYALLAKINDVLGYEAVMIFLDTTIAQTEDYARFDAAVISGAVILPGIPVLEEALAAAGD